jgi:hypothetical protein
MSHRLLLALAALALLGCSDVATRPESGAIIPDPPQEPDAQRRLIECPTSQSSAASGLIGVLGGTVASAGSSISIPADALPPLTSVLIDLTVPASTYMEIDIKANGLLTFLFLKTVTVTIDYSRCPASVTQGKTLTVWLINSQTKALLVNMNGVNDPVQRRMTFMTDHLSGYAIAQ